MSESMEVRSPNADEVVRLRREIAGLEQELEKAQADVTALKAATTDSVHAIRALRKVLEPFRVAIGMIYGEISRVDVEAEAESSSYTGTLSDSAKWNGWKARLGGKKAEIIDLLLLQDSMTIKQISKAVPLAYNTAQQYLQNMAEQGVLTRNGFAYSLKR